jgi:hypothetical protein
MVAETLRRSGFEVRDSSFQPWALGEEVTMKERLEARSQMVIMGPEGRVATPERTRDWERLRIWRNGWRSRREGKSAEVTGRGMAGSWAVRGASARGAAVIAIAVVRFMV